MVHESRETPRLHPSDVDAISRNAARLVAAELSVPPHPAPPSGSLTGADLKAMQSFDPDISALERLIRMVVQQTVSSFLTQDQILKLVREELGDIGLMVDTPESKKETAETVRSSLKWQKRWDTALNTLWYGLIVGAIYAVAKLMGITLPPPPSGGGS